MSLSDKEMRLTVLWATASYKDPLVPLNNCLDQLQRKSQAW